MDRSSSFVVCCEETGHFACPGEAGVSLQKPADSETEIPISVARSYASVSSAPASFITCRAPASWNVIEAG